MHALSKTLVVLIAFLSFFTLTSPTASAQGQQPVHSVNGFIGDINTGEDGNVTSFDVVDANGAVLKTIEVNGTHPTLTANLNTYQANHTNVTVRYTTNSTGTTNTYHSMTAHP